MQLFLVVISLPWDTNLQTYPTGSQISAKTFAPGSLYSFVVIIGISLNNIPLSSATFGTQIVVDIHSLIIVRKLWVYLLWSCPKLGRASISQLRRA
ncbi:hypothetical protein C8R44DRAFT_823244 [Mycena epipterygia]|nr:hypothetical protein C8R44DRAFT_823244 [Mycena epipterygia]